MQNKEKGTCGVPADVFTNCGASGHDSSGDHAHGPPPPAAAQTPRSSHAEGSTEPDPETDDQGGSTELDLNSFAPAAAPSDPPPADMPNVGDYNADEPASADRGKPSDSDGGFCWQNKLLLNHVADAAEADARVSASAARSVYLALTQLSSDIYGQPVVTSVSEISFVARISNNTTAKSLDLLFEAGFIHITKNVFANTAFKAPSTYSLLKHNGSICNYCLSNYEAAKLSPLGSLLEENLELDKMLKKAPAPQVTDAPPLRWLELAQQEFPNRGDLEAIARKLLRKYPRGHPKRCYKTFLFWIHIEMNPVFRYTSRTGILPEPSGWREVIRALYPQGTNPAADESIASAWSALAEERQAQFTKEVERAGARRSGDGAGAGVG